MEQLVDRYSLESVGYMYSDEESAAAIFALKLYSEQLVAGNIIDNPETNEDVVDLLKSMDELRRQFEEGLLAVTPRIHEAMTEVFFPYLDRMHRSLSSGYYQSACGRLGVTPFELFNNSLIARSILRKSNVSIKTF